MHILKTFKAYTDKVINSLVSEPLAPFTQFARLHLPIPILLKRPIGYRALQ